MLKKISLLIFLAIILSACGAKSGTKKEESRILSPEEIEAVRYATSTSRFIDPKE